MEKETVNAAKNSNKASSEIKGQDTSLKDDAISKGDSIQPSEPHERAKVPDKGDHCVTDLNRNENSCHDDIQRSAQQLIDDINAKRKRDTDLLNDFKKALEEQINTSCGVLEDSIVHTYEKHSKSIQDKLQELFAVLERISKLESELMDFKHALGALYNDMKVV